MSDTNQDPEKLYEKIKNLGEGPLGDVWLVSHKITGKQSAMKIIEKSPCYNEKEIKNEIEILKMMDHPYILKILEFHLTEDKFYILTDYCPEGDLFGEICIKTKFSEQESSFIIYQILQVLIYCHKMRVVHRDIKPENIMITERENNGLLHIKLMDFGISKIFFEGNEQRALEGSSFYIAPEILKGKYDEKCDLWSVGVIMYILLTGIPPFNGDDYNSILEAVLNGKYDTNLEGYEDLTPDAKDLISKLLEYNPEERISAKDALNHLWFQTKEFKNISSVNTISTEEAKNMLNNLELYKRDNIIKCAVLAYIVNQNANIKEYVNASYLFSDIDLNKDRKIEKNELINAYMKYFVLPQDQATLKANAIFLNIDTDNCGYIKNEEFIRACINPNLFVSQNYLSTVFNYFDEDNNKIISFADIQKKFHQISENKKMELKKMFEQIDTDNDGQISFEEFSNMIKSIISS